MELRECPFCREEIEAGALKCRHCQSLLDVESLKEAGLGQENQEQSERAGRPAWKKWLVGGPVALIIIALVITLSGASLTGGSKDETVESADETADLEEEPEANGEEDKPGSRGDTGSETVTLENIVNKYEPKFEALEDKVAAELEALFDAALKEYEQGGGPLFQLQLVNKYMRELQKVEDRADAAFYSLLEEMNDELISYDLPTDIIAEIEEDYKQKKQAMKRELSSYLADWDNW